MTDRTDIRMSTIGTDAGPMETRATTLAAAHRHVRFSTYDVGSPKR